MLIFCIAFIAVGCVGMYTNPVVPWNSPDPGVIELESGVMALTTGSNVSGAFSVFFSKDKVSYEPKGVLFKEEELPKWAIHPGNSSSAFWAPEIHALRDGRYLAIYTARSAANRALSVGLATAESAWGPWIQGKQPLVTNASMGYIDASFYYDVDGSPMVVWKSDGNAVQEPTPIHTASLNISNLALNSSWTTLITNDLQWEGFLVEAPWMVVRPDAHYLFYSGSGGKNYAVGVAKSTNGARGPFIKHGPPILSTSSRTTPPFGSGHCSVRTLRDGNTVIFYHIWPTSNTRNSARRTMAQDLIHWGAEWPTITNATPSTTPQPTP